MKRNRNIGWTVVYPHILEGARKELQDHAGHEFELQTKLHQVSNAPMNSNFQRPISAYRKLCQYFGAGGGNCNVQISNVWEGRGWGMLKFRINRRITANSK